MRIMKKAKKDKDHISNLKSIQTGLRSLNIHVKFRNDRQKVKTFLLFTSEKFS